MKTASQALRVELIDHGPVHGNAGPDEITALSGLLTSKQGRFHDLIEGIDPGLVEALHREATRRGHASLLTTPVFYFWIEGSRMIDYYLTAFPFGSYLMYSSRRIRVSMDNMIVPDSIRRSGYYQDYRKTLETLLEIYESLLERAGFDQARNILPLGFSSYGLFALPMQTIMLAIREADTNPYLPTELVALAREFESILEQKAPRMLASATRAGDTGHPYPDLFGSHEIPGDWMVELVSFLPPRELESFSPGISHKQIASVLQTRILARVSARISLAGWNEVKRHRTVRQRVESVYSAIKRYQSTRDENLVHVPPSAGSEYVHAFDNAMSLYQEMVDGGIPERDAVYIVPQCLTVGIELLMDGYHLFDPYGFVGIRSCTTAHYEVRSLAERIAGSVAEQAPWAESLLGPKCKTGECPEKNPCGRHLEYQKKKKEEHDKR